MTEKLYGLDDILMEWTLKLHAHHHSLSYCTIEDSNTGDVFEASHEEDPKIALHKAIQKAKGEI